MKRLVLYSIIIAGCVGALWWLGSKLKLLSGGRFFNSKPLVIDETPVLVQSIQEMAALCVITAYDEVVADSVTFRKKTLAENFLPDFSGFAGLPVTGSRIVVIGRGKVTAGIDLLKLSTEDVFASGDSVSLLLPAPELLDVIMNPDGYEIFSEQGNWNEAALTAVKIKARNTMVKNVLEQQILEKAQTRSEQLLRDFLYTTGFKKIKIAFKTPY